MYGRAKDALDSFIKKQDHGLFLILRNGDWFAERNAQVVVRRVLKARPKL
jgi:hypothetical protein